MPGTPITVSTPLGVAPEETMIAVY
jgi:hypothetical protein